MRFTSQLQHLNASTSSATKAANYALKYTEFSEDLHSCILEQLDRNNMNNRANIMYFLPALCEGARAQNEISYVRMLVRDIGQIVDLVAPDDGSGNANVKVVRKVLKQLGQRDFVQPETISELEDLLSGRESALPASPPPPPPQPQAPVEQDGFASVVRSTPHSNARDESQILGRGVDKRQIEQRIEEDRERHKRAREGIWVIPQENISGLAEDAEMEKLWDGVSDAGEDDYKYSHEELDERARCMDYEET